MAPLTQQQYHNKLLATHLIAILTISISRWRLRSSASSTLEIRITKKQYNQVAPAQFRIIYSTISDFWLAVQDMFEIEDHETFTEKKT